MNRRSKFHVDFADLEIEIRKSIKQDKITEKLGEYIMKITQSILSTRRYLKEFSKERLDELEFEVYDYIIRKLLVNYDTSRNTGFAFIRSMALNRIASTKRNFYSEGIDPEISITKYDPILKKRITYKFLTIANR